MPRARVSAKAAAALTQSKMDAGIWLMPKAISASQPEGQRATEQSHGDLEDLHGTFRDGLHQRVCSQQHRHSPRRPRESGDP
jgi:hypothetical protein